MDWTAGQKGETGKPMAKHKYIHKTNSKVNLLNDEKLTVTKNLRDLPWGYIDQDEVVG